MANSAFDGKAFKVVKNMLRTVFRPLRVVSGLALFGSSAAFGEMTVSQNVVLNEDTDWRDQGMVTIPAGVTVDLNGHSLAVRGLSCAGSIVNLQGEYQELAYIESFGKQWISTGFVSTGQTGIDFDFTTTGDTGNHAYFCGDWAADGHLFVINGQNLNFFASNFKVGTYSANTRYRLVTVPGAEKNIHLYNVDTGTELSANTVSLAHTGSGEMKIFAGSAAGGWAASYRLHAFKMTESGTVVRDYVPMRRLSDGVAGLYDYATQTFKVSEGSEPFAGGPAASTRARLCLDVSDGATYSITGSCAVHAEVMDGCMLTADCDLRCFGTDLSINGAISLNDHRLDVLPLVGTGTIGNGGYRALSYIESNGSQWLNTGFVTTDQTAIDFDFTVTGDTSNKAYFCGDWANNGHLFVINGANVNFFGGNGTKVATYSANMRYHFMTVPGGSSTVLMYNGTSGSLLTSSSVTLTHTGTGEMTLFAANSNGVNPASYRLHAFKLTHAGTVVRDYVPARRLSDGAVGLYDRANGTFHTSNGRSEFIAGAPEPVLYGGNGAAAELHVNVPAEQAAEMNVRLVGDFNLVKEGPGVLNMSAVADFTGEVAIDEGMYNGVAVSTFDWNDFLAHRWSFNGTYDDSVGAQTATASNANVLLDETAVTTPGGSGYVELGANVLPNDGSPVTVEIWATENSIQSWSTFFSINDYNVQSRDFFLMSWTVEANPDNDSIQLKTNNSFQFNLFQSFCPYELGRKYLLAIKILPNDAGTGNTRFVFSQWDAATGALLKTVTATAAKWSLETFPQTCMRLGYGQDTRHSHATFDEVRVWKMALDDEQLKADALHGPDAGPFNVRAAIGERGFFSVAEALAAATTEDTVTLHSHVQTNPLDFGTTTAGALVLTVGAKMTFDITQASDAVALTAAGGIVLPEGCTLNDLVVFSDPHFAPRLSDDGMSILAVNTTIPFTAVWVGEGDCSNLSDSRNWICYNSLGNEIASTVPSNLYTRVTIYGPAASSFNCRSGQTPIWFSLEIGDCTLTADCDWRGCEVNVNGCVDLAGHKLFVRDFNGTGTICNRTNTAFRFYRFKVEATGVNGFATTGGAVQIGELKLFNGTNDVTRTFTQVHYDASTFNPEFASDFNPTKAVDGDLATKWYDDRADSTQSDDLRDAVWLTLEYAQPILVTDYTWFTGNDTANNSQRNPTAWRLQGSNDNTTWVDLDVVQNESSATANKTAFYVLNRPAIVPGVACGELHIDVPAGQTKENKTVTFSGYLKLVKDGAGTFVGSKPSQKYVGGTEIATGILTPGLNADELFGSNGTDFIVDDGAQYRMDIYAPYPVRNNNLFIAGSGPDGKGAIRTMVTSYELNNGSYEWSRSLTLTADAVINHEDYAFSLYAHNGQPLPVNLNGYELTFYSNKPVSQHRWPFLLSVGAVSSGPGTLVIGENLQFFPYVNASDFSSLTLVVTENASYTTESNTLGRPISVSNLVYRSTSFVSQTKQLTTVLGCYTPATMNSAPKVQLGDAAHLAPSIDLGDWTEPFDATLGGGLTFFEGACVSVLTGARKPAQMEKLISWSEIPSATFSSPNLPGRLRKLNDGLYYYSGLMVIIR